MADSIEKKNIEGTGIEGITGTDLQPWMKLNRDGVDVPVAKVSEFVIKETGADTDGRIYYPEGKGPFPVMFYIHGGAFVGGFNIMDEPVCRQMCRDAQCAVISPNYQLAPDHKWPAALNELYALLKYFKQHAAEYRFDMDRLAIGGASAGGNLSAAICVKAYQEKDFTFCYMAIPYPVLELKLENEDKVTPFTDTVAMAPKSMTDDVNMYVEAGEDYANPLISPMNGPLEAFPPTGIFSGRKDLFWLEGKRFADRLSEGGREVLYKSYGDAGHGFLELAGREDISREVKELICSELKRHFARCEKKAE